MRNLLYATALALSLVPMIAHADEWGDDHPRYLHAMSDLREAYWLIQHHDTGDRYANVDESRAAREIREAYQEIKHAAASVGEDVDEQPPPDMDWGNHGFRLHRVADLLRHAQDDVSREEDDWRTRGLQHRAEEHIDNALSATEAAIRELDD